MLSEKKCTHIHTTNVIGRILCLKVPGALAESCKQTKKCAYKIIHLFHPWSQVQVRKYILSQKDTWRFILKQSPQLNKYEMCKVFLEGN